MDVKIGPSTDLTNIKLKMEPGFWDEMRGTDLEDQISISELRQKLDIYDLTEIRQFL